VQIVDVGLSTASIESLSSSLHGPYNYDLVMAIGSLHHAPRELIQEEMRGSWFQVAYPIGWRSGFSQPSICGGLSLMGTVLLGRNGMSSRS